MVIKQNHIVCPKESDSSEMGLTRKSAVESGGSAVKLSGFGDLLKKRISLANVSGKKNSGKPSPSSIRSKNKNLVIISPWSIFFFHDFFSSFYFL